LSLLSGSHEIDLWLDGAKAQHLALVEPSAEEIDIVRNGPQVWSWDSATETATHLVVPKALPRATQKSGTRGDGLAGLLAPQQFVPRLFGYMSTRTYVTTGPSLYVAGEPAYQLILSPGVAGSTIGHIEVDLGARGALRGVPLRVAVYATGQGSPALEVGFTGSVHMGTPPASELTFTPPPGAKVATPALRAAASKASSRMSGLGDLAKTGSGWTTVVSGPSTQVSELVPTSTFTEMTTVVRTNGQRARLFSTDLLNVLFMPDGRFYAGFVTPGTLEAAVPGAR
jgi:hypothetical protein